MGRATLRFVMLRTLSTLLMAAVLAACSSNTRDGEKGEGPLAKVDAFCAEWASMACNDSVVDSCAASDADACITGQAAYCESIIPAGKYSDATAEECLEAVEAAYEDAELTAEERDTVLDLGPPCNKLISGSAGPGETCTETADCNTDANLVCVLKADEPGTCQEAEIVEGGFDCTGDAVLCADGFYCNGENCIQNKGEGATCSSSVPCQAEFKCERPTGMPPSLDTDDATCIAKVDVGESCEKHADCLSNICAVGATDAVCVANIRLAPTDPICEDLR